MTKDRTLVAGAGLMGHGIAQVLAATGRSVALYEPELGRAEAGRDRVAGNLDRSVAKGRLEPGERSAILGRIEPTSDLAAAAADVDLVVEAVFEDLAVKSALWSGLD
jgi:3-hydroxybutyryl-CoA dehydrogenase